MAQAVYGVFTAHGGADSFCGVSARDEPGCDGTVHGAGAEECYMFGHLRSLLSASFVPRGRMPPAPQGLLSSIQSNTGSGGSPHVLRYKKGLRFATRM